MFFDASDLAKYLLAQNLTKGHIAILGPSSYEWIITYLGVVFAGMVVVPLNKELSAEELSQLLHQADVDCIFYDERYKDIAEQLINEYNFDKKYFSLNETYKVDCDICLPQPKPDKLSAILFTSGTTGKSKGVMLTQRNISSNVIQGLGAVSLQHDRDVIMSVLPFHHAYEFTCTILGMMYAGVPICISSGLKYIQKDLLDYKPTVMFVVPLLAEKLYEKIQLAVKKKGREKGFALACGLSNVLRKIGIDITDRLFREVKVAFGGRLRLIASGGAPLREALIKQYKVIGITLFQAYGLTECSPILTVNFDYFHRPNSVGKIVQGNVAKVVDGEIWAKGLSVASGYYNNPKETAQSFQDGWFKTGDLGWIDKDGFIYLTGRKKNLIILSNGENVSAEELESLIYTIPSIQEVLVYAEQDCILAEIYLNPDFETNEVSIKQQIDKLNNRLPLYKRIDRVVFRECPFEKTTSHKIKRIEQREKVDD